MIDLAVAYRIYPGISSAPAFHSTDKFKLAQMCLQSFKQALGGLQVKVWAILDGCPPQYEQMFRETFAENELEVLNTEKIGNLPTFSLQIDLLTRQTEAEFVYLAEDDHFYLPNAIEKMVKFMRANPDVQFATAYDHPDSYRTSSRLERHLVRPFGDRYWRTASSTCLTFMATRQSLIRDQATFRSYSHGNHDCSVWLTLTQKWNLLNPRIHWCNLERIKIWIKMARWGTLRILFGRRYELWVPMPTLATHMESTCLAPIVDWQSEFETTEDKK